MIISELYCLFKKYPTISTDTRDIKENSIFFALKGTNFNGNEFASQALEKGAKYAIVDEIEYATNSNSILVENVLETLQKLANFHRKALKTKIISLTGSNGKTTTKELISKILSKKYSVTATKGNLNNHIGVPLTLLSITENTDIAVVEMGANHPKEIAFLASIVEPDYGYITNFGKAHLEGFGSVEGVIKAKSELYDYLIANNKIIFVNPNDVIQLDKTKNAKRILFSDDLTLLKQEPYLKLAYKNIEINSNLIGNYNFNNLACAISIGTHFNVSDLDIKSAIEEYIPTNNRSQIIEKGTNKIILDAYNANPTSMSLALDNFASINVKRKYIIFGDMFELGKYSTKEHQLLVDKIDELGLKNVCLVGENFCKTSNHFNSFKTYEELEKFLTNKKITESTILIKGSRGMKLERCLDLF